MRPSLGQLTWFAFFFAAFFALTSLVRYAFLDHQATLANRADFEDSAAAIARAVALRDRVEPAQYIQADFQSLDYVAVLRDGTVLEIKRTAGAALRGILPSVSTPLLSGPGPSGTGPSGTGPSGTGPTGPTVVRYESDTLGPESWTVMVKPLLGGVLVIGFSALEDMAGVADRLRRNLERFGDTLETAAGVNRNRIDNRLGWLVIDDAGALVNGDGRLPLKTDAMRLGAMAGREVETAADGRLTLVAFGPLRDVAGNSAGTLVQFKDVTRERAMVNAQLRFSGAVAAASFVVFLALAAYYSARHEGEKRAIREAFQHYFSPPILEAILREPAKLVLGGQRREVTILFSDIRSFTSLTERLPPQVLSRMLREYFDAMTQLVFATDGVVDKYIGDALMAFWGAPIDQPDQADRAVRAAIGMVRELRRLQAQWRAEGLPVLDAGIGINLGVASVGNFGSTARFDYTLIGDAVNVASRIERVTKERGGRIIISETTSRQLTIAVPIRDLGDVALPGKDRPVRLYEVQVAAVDDIVTAPAPIGRVA